MKEPCGLRLHRKGRLILNGRPVKFDLAYRQIVLQSRELYVSTSAVPTNISRLAHGVKWICLLMKPSRNSRSSLPQKYVSFKKRTRNYKKQRPAITFIPPRVNAFSASGTTAGFISTTGASIGISRLPIIQLIYFRLKSVGHTLIMRFRYEMCMCIGVRMRDNGSFVRIDVII